MTKQELINEYQLPAAINELKEASSFTGHDRLADAARRVMAKHLHKLVKHLPGVLSGDDPHDIHQMRVSTRRLRACLHATAAAFDDDDVAELRQRLRRLARVLGEVRDRDVMLLRLQEYAAQLGVGEDHALVAAVTRLQGEREKAHATLVRELGRKRTLRLLHELTHFLTDTPRDDDLLLLVRHHAGSTIWHTYEAALRYETIMLEASSEQLHELRIACKHLRYTLELFEPALGEKTAPVIELVTQMQEHLGHLHDFDVMREYLGAQADSDDQAPDDAQDENGGGAYMRARMAERDQLLAGVQPLWQQLSDQGLRQHLAYLIAIL